MKGVRISLRRNGNICIGAAQEPCLQRPRFRGGFLLHSFFFFFKLASEHKLRLCPAAPVQKKGQTERPATKSGCDVFIFLSSKGEKNNNNNTHAAGFFSLPFFSADTGTKSGARDQGHQSRRRGQRKRETTRCKPLRPTGSHTVVGPLTSLLPRVGHEGKEKKNKQPSGDCSVSLQFTHFFLFFVCLFLLWHRLEGRRGNLCCTEWTHRIY